MSKKLEIINVNSRVACLDVLPDTLYLHKLFYVLLAIRNNEKFCRYVKKRIKVKEGKALVCSLNFAEIEIGWSLSSSVDVADLQNEHDFLGALQGEEVTAENIMWILDQAILRMFFSMS